MKSAPLHPNESKRLADLLRYEVLDTESEKAFDELTSLAAVICGTPISLISLVDDHRQWFKSKVGLDADETDKSIAFCSHAILQDDVFEVSDTLEDIRFSDNPLVTGAPDIRFYAGAPLRTPNGHSIGTLCVIGTESKHLSSIQVQALQVLANQVIGQLELRLHNRRLRRINKDRERMFSAIAHDLKSPFNVILGMSRRLSQRAEKLDVDFISGASKSILNASMQAYHLLDELLQWSQTRMGAMEVSSELLDLRLLANQAVEIIESSAQAKNIEIFNTVASNFEVFADPTLIKTIIRNLVANAIKFSPEGGQVIIAAGRTKDGVEVSIQDCGAGITRDNCGKLFACHIESSVGSAGETGHGIGLRLCAEFIKLHNGAIWVDDQYTDGARIIFSVPKKL